MNRIKTLFSLPLLFALTACGGGGDVAADVATFSAIPSAFTWSTTCPGGGVVGAESIHIINGGEPPFTLIPSVSGLEVGLVSTDNQFLVPPSSMLNSAGDLVLDGKDPKFAVRATLGCDSDVSVTVIDYHSKSTPVSIKVEGS